MVNTISILVYVMNIFLIVSIFMSNEWLFILFLEQS